MPCFLQNLKSFKHKKTESLLNKKGTCRRKYKYCKDRNKQLVGNFKDKFKIKGLRIGTICSEYNHLREKIYL